MDKAKSKDYTKVCWSCGKKTMQLVDNFFRCSSCGATWNEVPTLGRGELVLTSGDRFTNPRYKPWGAPD